MRDYELTLVLDPDLTSENQKKLTEKIKKTIEELKGKVEKFDEWGRKELAYPIKKKKMGFYLLWEIKLPEKAPPELNKKLKLEEEVIRFLLVKKDTKKKGGPTLSAERRIS
jgi:small subunit ribosomal protein S6